MTNATARPAYVAQAAALTAAKKEAALLNAFIQGKGAAFYEEGLAAVKVKRIVGEDHKVTRRVTILPCPYKGMERAAWKRGADEALDLLYSQ